MGARPTGEDNQAFWHDYLTRGDSFERRARGVLRLLPHEPRCQLCAAPFAGPASVVMRAIGKRPATKNPRICASCFTFIERHHGGAEIEASFLFADIRGSTTIAERMSRDGLPGAPGPVLCDRHGVLVANGGGVDKFVGDEVVAMFFPLMSGPRHPAHAVDAAAGPPACDGPRRCRRPVDPGRRRGAHRDGLGGRGRGRVAHGADGARGHGERHRTLASVADAGEILVTSAAAKAAGLDPRLDAGTSRSRARCSRRRW